MYLALIKNNFVLVDLNRTYVFTKIDYLTNIMDLLIHFCLARWNVLSAWELPITLHLISSFELNQKSIFRQESFLNTMHVTQYFGAKASLYYIVVV